MTYVNPNAYHGMDPEIGVPHALDSDGKRVVRLETDGRGRVVEHPVGPEKPTLFGLPRGTPGRMRERFARIEASKHNSHLGKPDIRDLAVQELRADGPMTREELAQRLGVFVHQLNHALTDAKQKREVTCEPDPAAGCRKYLWMACV